LPLPGGMGMLHHSIGERGNFTLNYSFENHYET
jgi:hypothetical protein